MTGGSGVFRVPQVAVPTALLSDPSRFGGVASGDLMCGTLVVARGQVQGLETEPPGDPPERIVMPGLAEPHVHLDKCHSVDRMADVGGDLEAALTAQAKDKDLWSVVDLAARARRGLKEMVTAGVTVARSHVDWSARADGAPPLAWDVLGDLAAEAPGLTLQRAALTGIDEMADAALAEDVARRVARSGGVLGSFIKHHNHRREGVENLFRLADRFGLALDFHVDEGLDPGLDGLEIIADVATEIGFQGPVLCGHACSLASRSADVVARLAERLAAARIAVLALPTTNLYLQGRQPGGTPDRRGLTRLHELEARGVPVALGTDNVCDAFCPIGRHDPMHTLSVAVLAGHLDPPFGLHLPKITENARLAMGLPSCPIDEADLSDLIVFEAPSLAALISSTTAPQPLTRFLESL